MEKKFIWILVSCLMVVTLLVASCGEAATDKEEDVNGEEDIINGEEEEEEDINGEEEEVVDGKDMVLNSVGKLVERPRYGGWYHLSTTGDIYRWDDASPGYYNSSCYALMLTNNELYGADWTKSSQGTGEASMSFGNIWIPGIEVPELATGYELPDNETIIYHIRKGVHWQDRPPVNGREMNAHDVAFSLWRSYGTPRAYLNNIYPREWCDGPQAINALDDWTVEVSNIPAGWQAAILASSSDYLFIVAPEAIDAAG